MAENNFLFKNPTIFNRLTSWLSHAINEKNIAHEIFIITLSYFFVGCGAWNDGLLGFKPSNLSIAFEFFFASLLSIEIISRILFTKMKTQSFYMLLALDIASVITVIPGLLWISVARLVRVGYAGIRLLHLLDKLATSKKNPTYLIIAYPFFVPLAAAIVLAFEKHAEHSPIHNYFNALSMCFSFAFSLGNIRPTSPWSMFICGALFLAGLICIGILTNAMSGRYIYGTPNNLR